MNDDLKDRARAALAAEGGAEALRSRPTLAKRISEAVSAYADEYAAVVLGHWQKTGCSVPTDQIPPQPDWDTMLPAAGRPATNLSRDNAILSLMNHILTPPPPPTYGRPSPEPPSVRTAARAVSEVLMEHDIEASVAAVRAVWSKFQPPRID